jgi:hypothetical protein
MDASISTRVQRETSSRDRCGTETSGPDKIVAAAGIGDKCADDWFGAIARAILGDNKPGYALHVLTGGEFDERSCQRYVAGTVNPPGYFIRALLRSDCGAQFLDAFMANSGAPWWLDQQRKRRVGERVLDALKAE